MRVRIRAFLLLLSGAVAACVSAWPTVSVAGPTVLYSFTAPTFSNVSPATNRDGIAPASRLSLGGDGFLYGTTLRGGANGAGSIFGLSVAGTLSNLYSFPAATNVSGEIVYDLWPNDLTPGTNGNLYGTTRRGGSNFNGTIFVISPSGSFSNVHTFAAEPTNSSGNATSAEGSTPTGALAQGNDGNFYGTTQYGGANDTGTIFEVTPAGVFTNLYSFGRTVSGSAGTNGIVPDALILASNGAFYGITQQGGVHNAGTLFKFSAAAGFTQIYSFNGAAPGNNPITPYGALVQGTNGNFFGTSVLGGSQGGGTIFEITGAGQVTLLHSFPQLDAGTGSALTLGVDGNFYGTAGADQLNGNGTLFRITPQGNFSSYSFGALDTNSDNAGGADPSAALTADGAGSLYGTCATGGTNGSGVVFQISGAQFIPPSFLTVSNSPPSSTNVPAGASVAFSDSGQGIAPLSYQWLRNGMELTDGGDVLGSQTNTLIINPVFYDDVGSYAVVISNIWGALTSSVTVLTVTPPGISITSPKANASTAAPVFGGTATDAPYTNINPDQVQLTNIIYSISNLVTGSIVSGVAAVVPGAADVFNWSFAATPIPGTNILSVQSVDISGNISPVVSRSFFYELAAPLTILTTGSGAGTFTITNGALLNLGQGYSITARPVSSVLSDWVVGGLITYSPTLSFIMQPNLVLTADLMARQRPAVVIALPAANARTGSSLFGGTAQTSPVLPGAIPDNVRLVQVAYWVTNPAAGSVLNGLAVLTSGAGSVSNWSVAAVPLPGTNILAVQATDVSGGQSTVVSRPFFYKVPAAFTLLKAGSGNGTFSGMASVPGDTPPTNGAMLNVGEAYSITAKPDPFSTFGGWVNSSGNNSSHAAQSFIMQPNFALTATFAAVPPVVTISSPAENLRTAAPVFQGTASGHFPISAVMCVLANISSSATVTRGTGTVSNWTVALVPAPGTNVMSVYCVDVNGNQSAAVNRRFFYKVPFPLTVTNSGPGNGAFKGTASVPGDIVPSNGAMLNIGESYSITALPDKSSLFSNWVGTVAQNPTVQSDAPLLSFVMESNLVLTVTFITNFFDAAAGNYNGLFFPAGGVSEETSGMLYNLALRDTGEFTGQLLTTGTKYSIGAKFDVTGSAAFNAGPLQVALTLDSATPQITGAVSGAQFTANLTAELASSAQPPAEYTVLFSTTTNDSNVSPPGDGYALVTNHAGVATITGALADGTGYSQNVAVSQNGDIPVYASFSSGKTNSSHGLLLGWINLTNSQAAAPTNLLTWIKKPSGSPALYAAGFTNILSVTGALWIAPPPNTPAISLTNGQVVVSNASLFLDFTNIAVTGVNVLTNVGILPTNALTGSISPKTGFLTITVTDGAGHAITNFGAILQPTTNGGGYFLASTNAGAISLRQ